MPNVRFLVRGEGKARRFVELRWEGTALSIRKGRPGEAGTVSVLTRKTAERVQALATEQLEALAADGWRDGEDSPPVTVPRWPQAQARLRRRILALGPDPGTEAMFRAFATWCAEEKYPAVRHDRAWLAFGHVLSDDVPDEPGLWPCEVRLVRALEPVEDVGTVEAAVVLWFPLTPALRQWLDDPHTQTTWVEAPHAADRLWARFRATIGRFLEPFAPQVEFPDPDDG